MEIKKLQKKDIKTAIDLIWTVFQEFEAPDYSEQGIETFKNFIAYNSMIEKLDRGKIEFWGCFKEDSMVGVIAARKTNHICLLFVKKEFHRQGIAKNLLNTVIENCKRNGDFEKITVNSSPYAVEAYHHLGFTDTDSEQIVNGIRFTPMEYLL